MTQQVIGERGSAGGHGEMAGARVDVGDLGEEGADRLLAELLDDFAAALSVHDDERRSLIESPRSEVGGDA